MTRSNVLLKTGVMEIGRKSACSCGVAVLGTGVIDANFHCLGTVEEAIDLLNKRASGPQKTGAPSRKNHAGSKSIPVAVLRLDQPLVTCDRVCGKEFLTFGHSGAQG